MMLRIILVFTLSVVITGCSSPGESDLEQSDPGSGNGDGAETCKSYSAVQLQNTSLDDAFDFYEARAYPILAGDCMDCHVGSGEAGGTGFVLQGTPEDDYQLVIAQLERRLAGYSYLVAKATALAGHTGGQRFSLSSPEVQVFDELNDMLTGGTDEDGVGGSPPGECTEGGDADPADPGEFFAGVSMASNEKVLSMATMLMLGRRPTGSELSAVGDGTVQALASVLRDAMNGEDFRNFLMVSANDQLQTAKFSGEGRLSLIAPGVNPESYYRYDALDYPGILNQPGGAEAAAYNAALAAEPLMLIAYIVENERPYTEVLTAGYTVFNSLTYEFFTANDNDVGADFRSIILVDPESGAPLVTQLPPSGVDDFVAGKFAPGIGTGYYINSTDEHPAKLSYPHAGVLTTQPWLSRWPNTSTNKNRKRAKMALLQFLGYDIELTAARPMDPDALNDPDNPTFNNPACTACHRQLDPLAGLFQNWGYYGKFRLTDEFISPGFRTYLREDALNDGYKNDGSPANCGMPVGDRGYCNGDLWYGTVFPHGFVFQGSSAATPMPDDGPGRSGAHDDATLQWASARMVEDPRFAIGTVKFWYEAIFNEKPLNPPVDGDPNFAARLTAYVAQQEMLAEVAAVLVRDNGNGPYNLKDMLSALFTSNWFRAVSVVNGEDRAIELANVGTGVLLTPEQLQRKIASTMGYQWLFPDQYGRRLPAFGSIFNVFYGGIDSDTVLNRTRQINPLMYSVIKRMLSEVTCEIVSNEFVMSPEAATVFDRNRGILQPDESYASFQNPMYARPESQRLLFRDYDGEDSGNDARVREILVHLHKLLWNEQVTSDSPEVAHSAELFDDFWGFEDGSSESMRCESNRYREVIPHDVDSGDPVMSAQSIRVWRDMLTYFMSDFRFLSE